jgi:toxin HigB-1
LDITFRNNKLKKALNDFARCKKEYGVLRAEKITDRLGDMAAALTLEDLRDAPGKYHELTQNRKGQWACHLDGPYRLVFEPHNDPIPTDADGRYIWIEIVGIEIVEVVDYHSK